MKSSRKASWKAFFLLLIQNNRTKKQNIRYIWKVLLVEAAINDTVFLLINNYNDNTELEQLQF